MRYDFKSKSCFSGVLGYSGLAVVGKLVQMETKKVPDPSSSTVAVPCALLAGPALNSYWNKVVISPLVLGVRALLGNQLSPGRIWLQRAVGQP